MNYSLFLARNVDDHLEHARGPLGSVLKNLLQKLYYKDNGRIILRSLHNSPSLTYPCFLRDQISFSFSFTHCAAYTASTGPKPGANAGHETLQTRKGTKRLDIYATDSTQPAVSWSRSMGAILVWNILHASRARNLSLVPKFL